MANAVELQFHRPYVRFDPISHWSSSRYFFHDPGTLTCWICGDSMKAEGSHMCQPRDLANEKCFMCGERMQNAQRRGVHLCSGSKPGDCYDPLLDFEHTRMRRIVQVQYEVERLEVDSTEKDLSSMLETLSAKADQLCMPQQAKDLKEKNDRFQKKYREMRLQRREMITRYLYLTDIFKGLRQKEAQLVTVSESREKKFDELDRRLRARERLCDDRMKNIEDQDRKINAERKKADKLVKLNVGGTIFQTSVHTLTKPKDSMLAVMFSGRHDIAKDEEGIAVLDRDPHLFAYVLNYLRNDLFIRYYQLPKEREVLEGLRMEADYFLLPGLKEAVVKALHRLEEPYSRSRRTSSYRN